MARPGAYAGPMLFDPIAVRDAKAIEVAHRPAKGIQETGVIGRPTWTSTQGTAPPVPNAIMLPSVAYKQRTRRAV